jgi:hypothetical protein
MNTSIDSQLKHDSGSGLPMWTSSPLLRTSNLTQHKPVTAALSGKFAKRKSMMKINLWEKHE